MTIAVSVRRKTPGRWDADTFGPTRIVEGCTRWPRVSTEDDGNVDRSNAVTTGWTLSAPVDCGITSADQVHMPDDADDVWWDVDGDPLPYDESPFSDWKPGVPIALARTRG